MIDFNYILAVLVLVAVVYLVLVLLDAAWKNKKRKSPDYYTEQVDSLNVSHEEFYKVLNFMLMYGIIDLEQYNKIQQKGLPYTG